MPELVLNTISNLELLLQNCLVKKICEMPGRVCKKIYPTYFGHFFILLRIEVVATLVFFPIGFRQIKEPNIFSDCPLIRGQKLKIILLVKL